MTVDNNGFITIPVFQGLQPEFETAVNSAVTQLNSQDNGLIHSIYLYGSVAERRATVAVSDLDLTLVLHRQPDEADSTWLAAKRTAIEQAHPAIGKVDFDIGILDEVLDANNQLSWGYWLKHHCICLSGADLREGFSAFRPSLAIAVAVNKKFMPQLQGYIQEIKQSEDLQYRLTLQRAAARKAIRATSILRGSQDTDWPDTLDDHAGKFIAAYPALEEEMDYLLAISKKPGGSFTAFIERLQTFIYWMNAEFQARSHTLAK